MPPRNPRPPRELDEVRRPADVAVRVRGTRRPFTQVGGAVSVDGDPGVARLLEEALRMRTPRRGQRSERLTHGFHTYTARMHPETARRLVAAFGGPGRTLLDPFCGSGTVLVEALVSGARAVGRDVSPLAVRIARAKTWLASREAQRAVAERAVAIAREVREHVRERKPGPGRRPRDAEWFYPHVVHELMWLREMVTAIDDRALRDVLELCLSSILVKVSRRASDTDERRMERNVAPGAASRLFAARAEEFAAQLVELQRAVSLLPRGPQKPDIAVGDARDLAGIADRSIDAIVTSPPYPNTYDYLDVQRMSLRWLGLEPGILADSEIGARRLFGVPTAGIRRWHKDGERWVAAAGRVLRLGGTCVVFMGDGMVGSTVLRATECLDKWTRGTGLRLEATASQVRPQLEHRMRAAYREEQRLEVLAALRRA